MEFDYVAIRYRKNVGNPENILGGFQSLDKAQEYLLSVEMNFMSPGFMYVDSPQGKYIYGENGYSDNAKRKWYSPEEIRYAIVYDPSKDCNVDLGSYLQIDEFFKFTKKNESVINKLKTFNDNKDFTKELNSKDSTKENVL